MEKLKILIVEDEVLIAEDLKDILISFGVQNILLTHTKSDGYNALSSFKPNVVLLDIRMEKELDGLELGNLINEKFKIPFIFITAHSDVALIQKILQTKPAGYITKPFKKSDLFAQLNLLISKSSENAQIVIKENYQNVIIKHNDILFIESEGNYLNIYTSLKKHLIRMTLEEMFELLSNDNFVKVHRSYVINKTKVTTFNKKEIEIGEYKIPLSRGFEFDNK
ncbi:MAG: response regulator transcription factor [Bacteroidetes bacterium]|nr:response regulator transcription factor [Bacteroidota bacterium]